MALQDDLPRAERLTYLIGGGLMGESRFGAQWLHVKNARQTESSLGMTSTEKS